MIIVMPLINKFIKVIDLELELVIDISCVFLIQPSLKVPSNVQYHIVVRE